MPSILVYEPTPRWTAILERHLAGREDLSIRWRPHREDFLAELVETPDVVAIVACVADAQALELLQEVADHNSAKILSLVAGASFDWECLARELSRTGILPDTVEQRRFLESVVSLIGTGH